MGFVKAVVFFIRSMLVARCSLAVENVALRQQLSVYKQSVKRPKLRPPATVSSGFAYLEFGLTGNYRLVSFSRKQ